MTNKWPHDDAASLKAFYGDPATGEPGRQLVPVVPPFRMTYDGKPIKAIQFHRKAAPALLAALTEIWERCGRDQDKVDELRISRYSGAYNPRLIRGSSTKWSNHAYGAAIDFDAEHNGFNTGHGTMPQLVIDAFKRQGALWGGDYQHRTDPMHFEFCSRESAPKFGVVDDSIDDIPPAAEPDPSRPPHGASSVEIEVVKRRLDAMGYHEFGILDGSWGGKTAAAIAAYKNDRHLRGEPVIDQALLDDLSQAEADGFQRPVADQRANATAADIKDRVPAVRQTMRQALGAKLTVLFSSLSALVAGVSDNLSDAKAKLAPVQDFLTNVPGEVWLVLIAAFAGFIWYQAEQAKAANVKDFNEGKRV